MVEWCDYLSEWRKKDKFCFKEKKNIEKRLEMLFSSFFYSQSDVWLCHVQGHNRVCDWTMNSIAVKPLLCALSFFIYFFFVIEE